MDATIACEIYLYPGLFYHPRETLHTHATRHFDRAAATMAIAYIDTILTTWSAIDLDKKKLLSDKTDNQGSGSNLL